MKNPELTAPELMARIRVLEQECELLRADQHRLLAEKLRVEEDRTLSEKLHRSIMDGLCGYAYCRMVYEQGIPVDFIYLKVNSAFENFTGLRNLIGRRATEIIPGIKYPDPEVLELYGRVASTGKSEKMDIFLRASQIWLSISVFSPEPEHFAAIFDVITEEKIAEAALKKSEAFLNIVVESSPNAMWISDESGTLIRMNQACREVLHLHNEEVGGKYNVLMDSIIEEQGFMPQVRDVYEKGIPARFLVRYDTSLVKGLELSERREAILDISITPILDTGGKVTNAIIQHVDQTSQVLALEALRSAEERLLEVLENSLDASYKRNFVADRYDYLSPVFEAISGYTPDEMNALPIGEVLELIHPDDREMIHGAISESMANTATPYHQVAYRFRHKDGCYRWFLDKFKVLRSHEDQPVARIGSVSDITGIKLTEETLRLTSQQLQSILDNTPALIYTKDLEGRLQLVNHEFETLFGRSREELIGKTSHDLLPKAVADAHVANDQEVIRTKTAVSMEESTGKNGDGKIFLSVKFPLVNPEGEVYGICGISSDITDRKRTELAIVESEEKYRTVFTTEKDALFLIDKETMRILDVNDSACQLYGYSRDEFLTMRNVDVSAEPEETLRAARDFTGRIELRYHKKKDGTVFPIDISANQYHLQGRMVILAAIRDISDQQRIRVEIEKKNQQLLKLNAEKDKFFSIISHDLRSPFNSLLGLTEIMADDLHELTGDQIRKMAGGIRSSAKKLINLVENLLEWSRLQRGISSFNPVPVRLSEAISIAMEQAQLAADRKAILVYRSIPENMVVPLDMHMFQSLMNNLVFNAVKFTPRGGEITIGARQVAGDSIEISVSDNGIGMRRETVENLFQIDKEISSPGTEGEPGSGLGLLLCKDFVGRHGGTLRVESELEKGSVFIFTLPLT